MPVYCCYWPVRPVTLTIEAPSPGAAVAIYKEVTSIRGDAAPYVRVALTDGKREVDHRTPGSETYRVEEYNAKPHDLSLFKSPAFLDALRGAGWSDDIIHAARVDMDRRCASLPPGGTGPILVSVDAFGQRRCYSRLWGGHARQFDTADTGSDLDAWCDGSGVATDLSVGAGAVVHAGGVTVERSHGCGPGTNNVAELTAVSLALATCTRLDLVVQLRSDSEYALGSVFNESWNPRKNLDLIREAQGLAAHRRVVPEHVRGDSGEPGNELADALARRGRRPR